MPKQQLKAWLPTPEKLRQYKVVQLFAPFLADPRLWHMNRPSMVRAVIVGTLCAFFPLPGQMPLAVIGAVIARANVPMSVALTWITNPLTGIPVYWLAYWIGATILGEPTISLKTIGVVLTDLASWAVGKGDNPFLEHHFFSLKAFGLGLVICAFLTAVILGFALNIFWRYRIAKDWKARKGYQSHIPTFDEQKKARKAKRPKSDNS